MTTLSSAPPAVHALLESAIDYAGLFPPASLEPDEAVRRYARYRESPDRWALGRLVVPARALAAVGSARRAAGPAEPGGPPWELSVTLGDHWMADLDAIAHAAGRLEEAGLRVAALEARVGDQQSAARLAELTPPSVVACAELPWDDRAEALLPALARHRLVAKARMGGTTAAAFPEPERVIRFLEGVARGGVPFKATAGLHHPWRGEYPLTYEAGAPKATMYGYLNLMVAALLSFAGAGGAEARAALLDREPGAVGAEGDSLRWRGHRFNRDLVCRFRRELFLGFGSCSFSEPMDELEPALRS
jgi:hypothetical protein